MDKPFNTLDRHFQLPHVRSVSPGEPFEWLRQGWQDLRENAAASLSYGAIFTLAGYAILAWASDLPYLFTAAISGFFLVAPLLAAGLYEISRRHARGEKATFLESVAGLRDESGQLLAFGAFLAFALIGWERISAILFALFYVEGTADIGHFFRDLLLSGQYTSFVIAYFLVGGVIAAVVFALSAVSVPMLIDREVDIVTAMMASLRAVAVNLRAMALWALLIVALVAIGFATVVGLAVLLPWLGHATWHAYKDLIE